MIRILIFLGIVLTLDFYALQSIRSVSKNTCLTVLYVLCSLFVLGNIIYQAMSLNRSSGVNHGFYTAFALFVLFYVPKFILIAAMFGEDVFRLFEGIYNTAFSKSNTGDAFFKARRAFIGKLALGVSAIPFLSILYGITKGKYNYKVLKYTLFYDDLPQEFDGYKVTQISDIHSGSFDEKAKIEYAVDLINEQASDVIMFTGDLVNSKTSEMEPWKATFSKLSAKDGIFSVLGNHDYGDYVNWEFKYQKSENFEKLLKIQKEIGFKLLMNQNIKISRGLNSISIIGVENWGKGGFKKKGDIDKACEGLENDTFKIVMSHDPSHWDEILKNHKTHFHLTLSGHTHGMQFGIEIPGWIKWSPAKWAYKHWAGLYNENKQFLNVNRGFGVLGFPGRVGIPPEISVITLKKS